MKPHFQMIYKFFMIALLSQAMFFSAICQSKEASVESSGEKKPSQQEAVKKLKELQKILETENYTKALENFQIPEEASQEEKISYVKKIKKNDELSSQGIDRLAKKGQWGLLKEVAGESMASSVAEVMKVPVDKIYALGDKESQALSVFYWDGKQLKILSCDNIR